MRQRLKAAFDGWLDIAALSGAAAAGAVAEHEIDILVNLNGYFGQARMDLFARRPAPLQVNYLGFPGTRVRPTWIISSAMAWNPAWRGNFLHGKSGAPAALLSSQ